MDTKDTKNTPSKTSTRSTMKEMQKLEKEKEAKALLEKCNARADELYGAKAMAQWSNANQGLWFLPIIDEEGNIEKMMIFKKIDRNILSYASTKLETDGAYVFIEQCMRDCYIAGDMEIIEDDDYFLPAMSKFQAMIEGKKAAMLKR